MDGVRIHLLGGFHVQVGQRAIADTAWTRRKAPSLLKLLALTPAHRLHREQVLEDLWPEHDPATARAALHSVLRVVRQVLQPDVAPHTPSAYLGLQSDQVLVLCPQAPLWVDVDAFEAAAQRAQAAGEPQPCTEALGLYRGELLPDDRYEDWTGARRAALRQAYLALLRTLAARLEAQQHLAEAISTWQQLIGEAPDEESAHRDLMRLYAVTDQRVLALRQYEQLTETLRRELDAEPSAASRRLHEAILTERLPALPTPHGVEAVAQAPGRKMTNLPRQLTSFVGRERECLEVKDLLAYVPLVTLTGPGGIGKTRLALHVAAELPARYADGVWLADLAALADPALIPQAVAGVLGVGELAEREIVSVLTEVLRSKRLLLILDNCEHLVEGCARLTETLLRETDGLQVLATSREPLGVPGETTFRVSSLELPELDRLLPGGTDLIATVSPSSAVSLFVDRARAVQLHFQVTPHNAAAIARICVRLDGIPLAIELAAARVGIMTVDQLAARLEDRFHMLTARHRTALPRHQTLRATLDWSYDLLTDAEQTLLRRLSVFVGGWTLEAAEVVGARERVDSNEVLRLLEHLVDKSLVLAEELADGVRYRMLETIRQYSHEKLATAGETAITRDRHLQYWLDVAERAEPHFREPGREAWLNRFEPEHENLQVALDWSLRTQPFALGGPHEGPPGLRLAAALWWYWFYRGHIEEARRWCVTVLAQPEAAAPTLARAKILYAAGHIAFIQADIGAGRAWLEASVALCEQLGDQHVLPMALSYLGYTAGTMSDWATASDRLETAQALAREANDPWLLGRTLLFTGDCACWQSRDWTAGNAHFTESLAIFRRVGDRRLVARALQSLSIADLSVGDYALARLRLEEAAAILRALGEWITLADTLRWLGEVAQGERQHVRARQLHEESLALWRAIGARRGVANALYRLGVVARLENDSERAATYFAEGLAASRDMEFGSDITHGHSLVGCLAGLAWIAQAMGCSTTAAHLFGAASRYSVSHSPFVLPVDRATWDQDIAEVRAALGEASFVTAWAKGEAMPLEDAISQALRLAAEVGTG